MKAREKETRVTAGLVRAVVLNQRQARELHNRRLANFNESHASSKTTRLVFVFDSLERDSDHE